MIETRTQFTNLGFQDRYPLLEIRLGLWGLSNKPTHTVGRCSHLAILEFSQGIAHSHLSHSMFFGQLAGRGQAVSDPLSAAVDLFQQVIEYTPVGLSRFSSVGHVTTVQQLT